MFTRPFPLLLRLDGTETEPEGTRCALSSPLSLAGSRGGPALFDAKAQESGGAR